MLRFSDARNFGRTLTGMLLIAAPAILLISSFLDPGTDHSDKLKELNAVAAHRGAYLLSGVLFLVGGLLIVAMGIGVMRLFRGPRGVTLGQVSGALLGLGLGCDRRRRRGRRVRERQGRQRREPRQRCSHDRRSSRA